MFPRIGIWKRFSHVKGNTQNKNGCAGKKRIKGDIFKMKSFINNCQA